MNELRQVLEDIYGYKTKQLSKRRIVVLTKESNRKIVMLTLSDIFDGVIINESDGYSSIGYVIVYGEYKVYVKHMNRQGKHSAGINNEYFIHEKLQNVSKITFLSTRSKMVIDDIIGVVHVGHCPKNRSKADIKIQTKVGDIPISIKMDNSASWESADMIGGNLLRNLVNVCVSNGDIELEPYNGVNRISRPIAIRCSKRLGKKFIFGSDININDGCILVRSFTDSDFVYIDGGKHVIVNVTDIIREYNDVVNSDYEPWLMFRNDSTRKWTKIPGIRAIAVPRKRLTKNTYIIEGCVR